MTSGSSLSPEMMILWTRIEILKIELPVLEEHIDQHWDDEDFDQTLNEMFEGGKHELESVTRQFEQAR